ncbi:hypothetical protein CFC21_097706 [Triticum aestivum]|uniref:F-box domain-containing protein n=2 Tax=Triticum aestivum TaxID=4565 RepID=A0A3B6RF68_WHEAT|nr:uncharacterized protein LOC123152256 [Triticum aestivum]KAF7095565.1 hypothetical protein CFC21_097706 [Triticum aestivum]
MPMPAIINDLLPEFFIRLPTPEDLARVAATCASFRQAATDRACTREFRRLHAPPLLGIVDGAGFHPALPPHPSAPAGRALANAPGKDFSFSFLPAPNRWVMKDARDGRVLLDRAPEGNKDAEFTEVVVCDPLHQRYLLLPPVPQDLAEANPVCKAYGPFLAPPSDEEAAEAPDTSFRVMWTARCEANMVAFVFSSSSGQWRVVASQSWSDLFAVDIELSWGPCLGVRHYAYGSFYWETSCQGMWLVLDARTMGFSLVDIPCTAGGAGLDTAIVEAGEGRLGMFALAFVGGVYYLHYTIREADNQWKLKQTVSLRHGYWYCILGATDAYLLLLKHADNRSLEPAYCDCLSLDIKTMQLERMCSLKQWGIDAQIYTNFPPSLLSSPTV